MRAIDATTKKDRDIEVTDQGVKVDTTGGFPAGQATAAESMPVVLASDVSVSTGADAWRYARTATLSDTVDEADAPARGFQVLVDCTVRYISRDTNGVTEVDITQVLLANDEVKRAVYRIKSSTTSTSGANIILGW